VSDYLFKIHVMTPTGRDAWLLCIRSKRMNYSHYQDNLLKQLPREHLKTSIYACTSPFYNTHQILLWAIWIPNCMQY